ncbi:hypothetical protein HDV06_004301 [Boothiomyces sp. JEL0866]|nr:hypothetical protein HDV06_004301 [Boothiomyces sp. JEL0866]
MSYYGCDQELAHDFAIVDECLMIFNVIGFIIILYCLIRRLLLGGIFFGKPLSKIWMPLDSMCILLMTYSILRFSFLFNIRRTANLDPATTTPAQIQFFIQTGIFLEFFYYLCGSVAANLVLLAIVKASAGTTLYVEFKVGEYTVSPEKMLKIVRLVIILITLVFCILWDTLGMTDGIETYALYRRCTYLISSFVIIFVSLPITLFFGGKVMSQLTGTLPLAAQPPSNIDESGDISNHLTLDMESKEHRRTNLTKDYSTKSLKELTNSQASLRPAKTTKGPSKQTKAATKIRMLQWAINVFLYCLYLPTATSLVLYVVGFESPYFQSNSQALFGLKITVDAYVWLSSVMFSFYLYYSA